MLGTVDSSTTAGGRWSFSAKQGLIARAGLRIWSFSNTFIGLDLPQGELDYQWFSRALLLEGGLRAGAALGSSHLHTDLQQQNGAIRAETGGWLRATGYGLFLSVDWQIQPWHDDKTILPWNALQVQLRTSQQLALCTRYSRTTSELRYLDGGRNSLSIDLFQLVIGYDLERKR